MNFIKCLKQASGLKPFCPQLTTFLWLTAVKGLLLVAVIVPTVPRFPLLPDSRVGALEQSVSSIPVTADLQQGKYQDSGLDLGPHS